MIENHVLRIAKELNLSDRQVTATAVLIEDGSTVPFIARYRKEATGSLDEVALFKIRDRLEDLAELDKRRDSILKSLQERELLTPELASSLAGAETLSVLEDLYLPFRPKRRTRAMIAREKGLEPLAMALWAQNTDSPIDPDKAAEAYLDPEKGVSNVVEALLGARDIIAEMISEDAQARGAMRQVFSEKGQMASQAVKDKEGGEKFRDYFDRSEPVLSAPSHRILAMLRGEKEGFLSLKVAPPEEDALTLLKSMFVKGQSPASQQVGMAIDDGYKRLLGPSMETEIRSELKRRADLEAIRVFADNVGQLLMAPPLGQKRVLALDPGFRTGCKTVCLDPQGNMTYHGAIFPHGSDREAAEAARTLMELVAQQEIQAIAIGNGTASRETESFVRKLPLPAGLPVVMVNESGASIYSASEVAREEFPDQDVTVRGAVSIGRRLMDPLAELVKIDPKSIGVGQYQHDVDQAALKKSLDDAVMHCVNAVGVDVNTASKQILTYVSGLGPHLASNIVAYRAANGPFSGRMDLKKVPRLGPKAFEQAAGFLRIRGGAHPLDSSAVHPESYSVVEKMASDLSCSIEDLLRQDALRGQIRLEKYVTDQWGLPTLMDILGELAKPGRDPREAFEAVHFAEGVSKLQDLEKGMKLTGIVTNVTAFGAFVDIGVHQDGLLHISQMSDRFVKDPSQVVKVQQKVKVTVIDVDLERQRISLSMKSDPQSTGPSVGQHAPRQRKPEAKPPASPQWQGNLFGDALRRAARD